MIQTSMNKIQVFDLLEALGYDIDPELKDDMTPILELTLKPLSKVVLHLNFEENS